MVNNNMSDARDYFSGMLGQERVCVPAYERMMQLYAFGHTNNQIASILESEFKDIDYNPMGANAIKAIIINNRSEFETARLALGMKCREKIQDQLAILFNATEDTEVLMVSVYVSKLREVLNQLADLDLDAKDADGNYINTSRHFVLMEMAEKLQSKMAKITGTDALREIEIFRKKAEARAKADADKGGLLPTARGRTMDTEEVRPNLI